MSVTISKKDLRIILDGVPHFIEEDKYSSDFCAYCGAVYGNASDMGKRGETLHHEDDCAHVALEKLRDLL